VDAVPQNEAGITVEGSVSDQQFRTVSDIIGDGTKHVMVFKLLGMTEDNQRVVQPVTVKTKPKCKTCGRVNKANSKFCTECGTSLTIV
jgi:tRNA(Ile2) C34 agmatinyltransferase TiaS